MSDPSDAEFPFDETPPSDRTNDDGEDDAFELTDEQKRALDLDRNVAITAGAGTGKTTALKERYRHILTENPTVDPTNVVTITFTRDATAELRDRIREVVDEELSSADQDEYDRWRRAKDNVEDAYVHTIHGFCSRILREFAVEASIHPDFETLDETDVEPLVETVARDVVMAALSEGVDALTLTVPEGRIEAVADDIHLLAELYSREELVSLLRGLVSKRPDSDVWVESVLGKTEPEYVDDVIARACPVGSEEADALAAREDVREALATIQDLASQEFEFSAEDDDGLESLDRIDGVLPASGIADCATSDRQQIFFEICDLVTSSGSVYSQSHYYAGSATRWGKHGREADNEELAAAFQTLIGALKPESRDLDVNLTAATSGAPYVFALANLYQVVRDEYDGRKETRNALDYSDLIERTLEFLKTHDRAQQELREQFEFVMVDEVQDTDPRQWDLVRLLTGSGSSGFDGENVFLVGDEKQSIYRFRQADVTMFRRARARLAAANPDDVTTSDTLSGNFRSLSGTLAFLNDLFDRVFEPEDEDEGYRPYEAESQRLTPKRLEGTDIDGTVEYLVTPERDDDVAELGMDETWFDERTFESVAEREAASIAARLTRLFDDPPTVYDDERSEYRPATPSDVAILFRTTTRLRPFERALEDHDVPYTSVGGQSLYDTPEIKPLVNMLNVLQDPERDVLLYGVLRSALFGLTDEELADLYHSDLSLWERLSTADGRLADARDCIEAWRVACGADGSGQTTKWGTLMSRIIDETGYLVGIGADERPRQAVVNVNQFRETLRKWEEGGALPLSDVLTRIERERSFGDDVGEAEIPTGTEGVQLRTVHSAKGLQFPIVLVPELGRGAGGHATVTHDEGRFPMDLAYLEEVDEDPVLGIEAPDPNDPLETTKTPDWRLAEAAQEREERAEAKRVLYVATTRVRDHLLLSSTHRFEDDANGTFGPFGTGEEAGCWRDWVQPVLLEDREILPELRSDGVAWRDLPNSTYAVRRPPEPVSGPSEMDEQQPEYSIEIPAPSSPPSTTALSATELRDLVTDESPATDEKTESETERKTSDPFLRDLDRDGGLDAAAFGTLVHRLCEFDRAGIDIEWDKHPSRVVEDPTVLHPTDVECARDHVRAGVRRVEELERTLDIVATYDELQVTLDLDAGRIVGDIDHLTVTADRYYVTDYKTDSLADRDVDGLAEHYRPQLRVYACALQQARPKDEIVLRLVFTERDEVRTERLSDTDIGRYRARYDEVLENA